MFGKITFYNQEKGYGFILGNDSNNYFFHISELKEFGLPTRCTEVSFTPSSSKKGLVACNISFCQDDDEDYDYDEEDSYTSYAPSYKESSVLDTFFQLAYFFFF